LHHQGVTQPVTQLSPEGPLHSGYWAQQQSCNGVAYRDCMHCQCILHVILVLHAGSLQLPPSAADRQVGSADHGNTIQRTSPGDSTISPQSGPNAPPRMPLCARGFTGRHLGATNLQAAQPSTNIGPAIQNPLDSNENCCHTHTAEHLCYYVWVLS
jgi:hypothetical protein